MFLQCSLLPFINASASKESRLPDCVHSLHFFVRAILLSVCSQFSTHLGRIDLDSGDVATACEQTMFMCWNQVLHGSIP